MSTTATDIPALRALLAEVTEASANLQATTTAEWGYPRVHRTLVVAERKLRKAAVTALPSLLDRLEAADANDDRVRHVASGDPAGPRFDSVTEMVVATLRKDYEAQERCLSAIEAYCRQYAHPGSSPGKQEACSAVLGIMGVK